MPAIVARFAAPGKPRVLVAVAFAALHLEMQMGALRSENAHKLEATGWLGESEGSLNSRSTLSDQKSAHNAHFNVAHWL
jgi:hypothetical protein